MYQKIIKFDSMRNSIFLAKLLILNFLRMTQQFCQKMINRNYDVFRKSYSFSTGYLKRKFDAREKLYDRYPK